MFICLFLPGCNDQGMRPLLELAQEFSPAIEETAQDTVVLDAGGCELLFGSASKVVELIERRAAEAGIRVNIAAAQNPDAAIHAARGFSGTTFIPPGREADILGPLSLGVLCPELAGIEAARADELKETLLLWGIYSFRDFAKLPALGISERLGPEGLKLQALARGTSNRPLVRKKEEVRFERAVELDQPLELLDRLIFVIGHLLSGVLQLLAIRGLATNELRINLRLEDGGLHERAICLPLPLRDHKTFLKLMRLDLESKPPQEPVVGVSVGVVPATPRVIQRQLFVPASPEPDKLEVTLARIGRLVGPQNVGAAELLDTHRPCASRIKKFVTIQSRRGRRGPGGPRCLMGLRLFRPALQARVDAVRGRPSKVVSLGAKTTDQNYGLISGKVIKAAGPWRTEGEWWEEEGWARDEWDVCLSRGGSSQTLCRIYKDLNRGCWFIEGVYD